MDGRGQWNERRPGKQAPPAYTRRFCRFSKSSKPGRLKTCLLYTSVVEAIDAEPGDTLLDVGFLDNGLYTAGNFQPITRYFCRLNVSIPEMKEEWRRVIRNGEADFVYTGERRCV